MSRSGISGIGWVDFGKAQELHRQVRHLTEQCLASSCGPSRGLSDTSDTSDYRQGKVIVIRFIRHPSVRRDVWMRPVQLD
jgi:hypothetical protein